MSREESNLIRRKRKKWSEITDKGQIMLETPTTEFLEALIFEEELDSLFQIRV